MDSSSGAGVLIMASKESVLLVLVFKLLSFSSKIELFFRLSSIFLSRASFARLGPGFDKIFFLCSSCASLISSDSVILLSFTFESLLIICFDDSLIIRESVFDSFC
jgi:hypothetical protein